MRVGVIGGGLMGSGIAEVCARSGVDVTVVEADEERVQRSRAAIERSLDRAVRSGKVSEEDKAERRRVIANNRDWDSASTVRRDWLRAFPSSGWTRYSSTSVRLP